MLCRIVLLLAAVAAVRAVPVVVTDGKPARRPAVAPANKRARRGNSIASAAMATPGSSKDLSLAGKPCTYTPAVFYANWDPPSSVPEWYWEDITACNHPALPAAEQAACARCIGQRTRDACLKTTADTFWGADTRSCTWVGQPPSGSRPGVTPVKSKEVRYSLGINYPSFEYPAIAETTCFVDIRAEVINPVSQQVFPTALFRWELVGQPTDESLAEAPLSFSNFYCTLEAGSRVCEGTLVRPAYLTNEYVTMYREIWTNRRAAVDAWRKTDSSCVNVLPTKGTCSALPAPYKFDVAITVRERPCRPFARPVTQGTNELQLPFGQTGATMAPGGESFSVNLQNGINLGGLRNVTWSVRVRPNQRNPTVPMLVAAIDSEFYYDACTEEGEVVMCDHSKVASRALPGTLCYARECSGSYTFKNPAPDTLLMIAYRRYTYFPNQPWIVNATEAPPQVVVARITASPY